MKTALQLFAISTISIFLVSCNGKPTDTEQHNQDSLEVADARPVKVQTISSELIGITETYPATISAAQEAHVAPIQPGQIRKIHVEVGDNVQKGKLLIEMDATQLNQTRVQYYDAKRDLQRMDSLIKYGSIAQQMYDKAKLQYEVLASALKTLEENTLITAPFSGVITGKYFNDRENFTGVAPQLGVSAILTIMQIDELKVEVNISERYFPQIREGMETKLETNIYPDKTFTGKIKTIYPTIDATTKTFKVEIRVANHQQKLRPGMFARVQINFGETDAIVIPANALLKQEGTNNRYIFVYENGIAKRIEVEQGSRFNDKIEIISTESLKGKTLINSGHTGLIDGAPVTIVEE